jgi:hypothetical protein
MEHQEMDSGELKLSFVELLEENVCVRGLVIDF